MPQPTAAIYCRLSVEDLHNHGQESQSILNQKQFLINFANIQGMSIYAIYSDDDYSGLDENRPGFQNMLSDAKEGFFQVIICKTLSRFTRDRAMVEKYIHGLFPAIGLRFISVIDGIDTNSQSNKRARQLYGLINEWYSEDLSENIRTVFRKKMEAGQFIGSFAPYGYCKNPENRHKLCVDKEAALIVKKIFEMFISGMKYCTIAAELTNQGILTPTEYKTKHGLPFANPNAKTNNRKWSSVTVKKILQNQIYTGALVQGRRKKISYKSHKVVPALPSDWIIIPNNHTPIISNADFLLVQNKIMQKKHTCNTLNIPTPNCPNHHADD